MKVRSMVGLIPLFAVETLEPEVLERLGGFKRRMDWFIANRPGPDSPSGCNGRTRPRTTAPAVVGECESVASRTPHHARRARVSLTVRHSVVVSPARRIALPPAHRWGRPRCSIRAFGIPKRRLRRQLELEGAGLAACQLPDRRVAPALSSLLRRRIPRRVPNRFRAMAGPWLGRGGAFTPARSAFPS